MKREKKSLADLTKGSCPSTMASRSSVLVPEMTFTGAGCRILSALRTLVPSCSLFRTFFLFANVLDNHEKPRFSWPFTRGIFSSLLSSSRLLLLSLHWSRSGWSGTTIDWQLPGLRGNFSVPVPHWPRCSSIRPNFFFPRLFRAGVRLLIDWFALRFRLR